MPVCYEALLFVIDCKLANPGWLLCPGAMCPDLVDGECHIVKHIDRLMFGLLQRIVHLHKQRIPTSPFSFPLTLQ